MLPYINTPFDYVGGLLGASGDELKLVFSFYLSYPLAGLLKRIPDKDPWKKNVFIISVSLFYLLGLFDLFSGLQTLAISAGGAYIISASVKSAYMPWVGFVFLMGHMSINHIYRQMVGDDSVVDITGAQMVMIMKLTAFCWNVQDGRLPESELSDFQKEHALKELPGLLDYAAYVLFFPALMAGPAFDYCDYRRYITTSMFALPPGTDPSKAPVTHKKRKIPRSGTPATLKAIQGTVWIVGYLKFSGWYNVSFLLSEDYMTYSLLRRIWILYMLGLTVRMKYYGVWSLTEGSCILSGIGYNGIDAVTGRAKWDRLTNIKPLDIELAQNTRAFVGSWNINTNLWLRNYVYLRVTPKGKKPGFRATLATFVTSAFWHGFYPGYYLTFVLAAFYQTIAKNARRTIRPLFLSADGKTPLPSKKYYDIATFVITQAAFGFAVVPFVTLYFGASILVWSHVYHYGIVAVVASFALFSKKLPARKFLVDRQAKRTAAFAEAAKAEERERERDGRALEKEIHAAVDGTLGVGDASASAGGELRAESHAHDWKMGPGMGLPDDPEAEFDEVVAGVKRELDERRRRGSLVGGGGGAGSGLDVKRVVEERLETLRGGKQ